MIFRSVTLALVISGLAMGSPARGQVVINELMYHPIEVLPEPYDTAEFIELLNASADVVDLDGWCLEGVGYCFPFGTSIEPNEFFLLARDAQRFAQVFGGSADAEYPGQLSNSGEEILLRDANGLEVDRVPYDDEGDWPVLADGLGGSIEVVDVTQDNGTPRNWRLSMDRLGHTAGRVNSVASDGLPPWILDVSDENAAANFPITIRALVEDATTVDLTYRIDLEPPVTIRMSPSESVAGALYFEADIPAQPQGSMVRYRLDASGPTGAMGAPRIDDSIEYLGLFFEDETLESQLPILHWWIEPEDFEAAEEHCQTDEREPAVLVYDGVVYDSIEIRARGRSGRCIEKKNWKFFFAQGHDFAAPELFEQPVDRFNLKANWGEKTHLREAVSFTLFEQTGSPSSVALPVRLEQNGEFFGLYTLHEDFDEDWLLRNGLDENASRYKASNFRADLRPLSVEEIPRHWDKQGREWEDTSDLQDLIVALNQPVGPDKTLFLFDGIDLPATVNYLATGALTQFVDNYHQNYYLYRDTEGTGRWSLQAWDLDVTWGRSPGFGDLVFGDLDSYQGDDTITPSHPLVGRGLNRSFKRKANRLVDALYAVEGIRGMYLRRLRTLMDNYLADDWAENEFQSRSAELAPEFELDFARWGQPGQPESRTRALSRLQQEYLEPRRVHLFETHRLIGEIPPEQEPNPEIVITEIQYHPEADGDDEFLELFNPSVTEGVDVSGWSVDGIGLVLPPGTVIPPRSFAVVSPNDPRFRATYGGGRFLPAQYDGKLSNGGESLLLFDAAGRLVDRVDYSDEAPWPTTPDGEGPSLELIDPGLDNNDPVNWRASETLGGSPGELNP